MQLLRNPLDYRRRLPHIQNAFSYFVSFRSHKDWVLPEWARSIVLETILKERDRTIRLYATTVMPEHAHLLFSVIPYSLQTEPLIYNIMKTIKGVSAHRINKVLQRNGKIWQAESFDRMLRNREDEFERYYDYIAQNAVKRGLASTPEEYKWHWHFDRKL